MQLEGDGHASAPASAALPLMGAVAAAILESQRTLGCSRCRYAKGGCRRCRNPDFKPRGSPTNAAAPAAAAAPAVARRIKGKRRRKAEPAGPSEPLLHTLRRQLASLHADSEGTVPQPGASADSDSTTTGGARDAAGEAPAAGAGAEAGAAQQQQLKRAAEGGRSGRPAKYLRAAPQLVSSLQQQQQRGGAPAASVAAAKRGASSDPSPSTRRPAKRLRALSVAAAERSEQAEEDAAEGAAGAAAGESTPAEAARQAAMQGKRAAVVQQAQRPPKFRRVAPPSPVPRQPQAQPEQAPAEGPGGGPEEAGAAGPGDSPGQGLEGMDVDLVSPRKRAAAAALERAAAAGASPTSAAFMAQLQENMQRRHEERQASASPHPLAATGGGKRHRGGSAPSSPAGLAIPVAAAAAEEPDPRLCLWEPPVSPFGLLEEELYDDPWKLLVACMLLNKTSGTQVRRVIWDLFALCPTPAAAVAADVQRIQALITPLGLFRKRAQAIQQLSQDYLYKQWREPTELFGIGKYGADAYHMFCRGAWRDVAPDDKDLRRYRDWLEATGGLGTGLTRHRTMPVASSPRG